MNTKTKNIFAIIITLSLNPVFADQVSEDLAINMLKKDPNSEKFRYEYAELLYKEEKFDKSAEQIDILLKLNPHNLQGMKLKKNIEVVKNISEPKKRKEKMLEISMAEMDENLKQLQKMTEDMKDTLASDVTVKAKEEDNNRKKNIDLKYKISESKDYCTPFDMSAASFEMAAVKYSAQNMKDKAVETYRAGLNKKDSAELRIGLIQVLFSQGKYTEANEEVSMGLKYFNKDVRFQIASDAIAGLRKIASTEEKSKYESQLQEDLYNAKMVMIENCQKSNR